MPSTRSSSVSAAAAGALLLSAVPLAAQGWVEVQKRHLAGPVALATAAIADLDGDGDRDLLTVSTANATRVWINDGHARFQPHPTTPTVSGQNALAGDVDGDGDTDVVLDGGVVLAQQGGFVSVPRSFGTVHECADFDGDGLADVLSSTGLWRSLGNGLFTALGPVTLPARVSDTAAADFDRDGDLDLVFGVSPSSPNDPPPRLPGHEVVWRNNGNGSFTDVTSLWFPGLADDITTAVVAADFDGDGDVDCALGKLSQPSSWTFRRNDGSGVLQPWTQATIWLPYFVVDAAADVDGDGDLDLPGMGHWVRNDGPAGFHFVPSGNLMLLSGAADLDGDGRPDLFGKDMLNRPRLLLNCMPEPFVDATRRRSMPLEAQPVRSTVGDCDADGDPDLLVATGPLVRNDGSGWTEVVATGWALSFLPTFVADVDGDGDADVVGRDQALTAIVVQRNQGGSYVPMAPVPVPPLAMELLAFDAEGDGDPDVLVSGMILLRNDGTGTFTPDPVAPAGGSAVMAAAAADFDGDGDADVLAADTRLHMFVNDGTGRFTWTGQRLGILPPLGQVTDMLAFDADGDGDQDAFVSQSLVPGDLSRDLLLLRNIGGGTLVATTGLLPAGQTASGHAASADLDADGDVDLAVDTTSGLRFWRNDGAGRMVDAGAIGTATAMHLAAADLDGDLDVDVVVGDRIFVNRQWHAEAPFLAQNGADYVVEFGGTQMPDGVAVPFLGLRARWAVPPFGTVGIDLGSAVPLPLATVTAGTGSITIPVPAGAALLGVQFGVQAILMDGTRFHLTPVVYDTVL